jgi:hypothetical protein
MHSVPGTPKLPYKSVAVALLFCAVLGPVGLLYASFWGGFVMIVLGIVVVCSKLIFPIILLWIICCLWGVKAAERYNRQLLKVSL